MADAEALARRLIEIDARLGLRAEARSGRSRSRNRSPRATTGPRDLDAKADILADQARRVRAQADALERALNELKGRQELRRRRPTSIAIRSPRSKARSGAWRAPQRRRRGSGRRARRQRHLHRRPHQLAREDRRHVDAPAARRRGAAPRARSAGAAPAWSAPRAARQPDRPAANVERGGRRGLAARAAAARPAGHRPPWPTSAGSNRGARAASAQALERAAAALRARAAELDARASRCERRPIRPRPRRPARPRRSSGRPGTSRPNPATRIRRGWRAGRREGQLMVEGSRSYMLRADAGPRADDPRVSLIAALAPAAGRADGGDDDGRYMLRAERASSTTATPTGRRVIGGATAPDRRLAARAAGAGRIAVRRDRRRPVPGARRDGRRQAVRPADARSENVAIAQSSGCLALALGARPTSSARRLLRGVPAHSTDPVRDAERRDFRSLAPLPPARLARRARRST